MLKEGVKKEIQRSKITPSSWGLIRTQLVSVVSGVWRVTIMLISHKCICLCHLCYLHSVLSSLLSLFFFLFCRINEDKPNENRQGVFI